MLKKMFLDINMVFCMKLILQGKIFCDFVSVMNFIQHIHDPTHEVGDFLNSEKKDVHK